MPHSSDVQAGNDVYASDLNNVRKDIFTGARIGEEKAGAAIVTLDFSDPANGNIKTVNVDQDITLRFSGITKYPTVFFVRFVQDSTGGWVVTIDQTGVKYPSGSQAAIANGSNEVTGYLFICNGANDFDCYYAGFGLATPA